MPGAADKVLINNGGLRAFGRIIRGWFKGIATVMRGSKKLTKEIKKNGWLDEPEAQLFLAEQETSCTAVDNACKRFIASLKKYFDAQMKRNEDMRKWIDVKRRQQP